MPVASCPSAANRQAKKPVVGDDVVLTEVVGAVDVTGSAALGADGLACQIVSRGNVGILGHDDGLDALGVGVGEVHDLQALVGDGDAGHDHVALAVLGGQQGGVKVHVIDLQLQTELLSDSTRNLNVDALEITGVGGHLIRGEGGVGGHRQLAGVDGGHRGSVGRSGLLGGNGLGGCSLRRSSLAGNSLGGSGTAAGGQAQHHSGAEHQSSNLFHDDLLDSMYLNVCTFPSPHLVDVYSITA